MPRKTISVDEDTYDTLDELKVEGQSFDGLLSQLASNGQDPGRVHGETHVPHRVREDAGSGTAGVELTDEQHRSLVDDIAQEVDARVPESVAEILRG